MSGVAVRGELFKFNCDSINLNEERLTDALAWELLEAMSAGKFSRLTRLHFENNYITDKGGLLLAKCIQINSGIKWLYLANNRMSDESALAVAKSLKANHVLQWIDMSGNNITQAGAIAFSRALCVNTCLQELYLHQNSIGDTGAGALAHALQVNTSLLRLGLGNNQISDKGAGSLALALSINSTLQQLWMDDNIITDRGAQLLVDSLRHNSSLQWLDLDTRISASLLRIAGAYTRRNTQEPLRAAAEVLDIKSQPFVCTIYHSLRRLTLAFCDPPHSLPIRLYAPPGRSIAPTSDSTAAAVSRGQRLQLLCISGSSEYVCPLRIHFPTQLQHRLYNACC
jgi:hypothetical protein